MEYMEKSETKAYGDGWHIRRIAGLTVSLFFLGVLLAGVILSVGNDMYAFVKGDAACVLTVEEPMTLSEIAKRLQREGIIENPAVFVGYVRSRGREETVADFRGEVALSARMSYREILLQFSAAA